MAPRRKLNDFDEWGPAVAINGYAVFMGYQSMAIKGLGFLIITWTTVVLLGGYVSALHIKDFWCLTFITLVQTAGIFDVYLNEKLSYILYAAHALIVGSLSVFLSPETLEDAGCLVISVRFLLAFVFLVVQMLALAILLCPLAAVYVFGLSISSGISLWRLIQHDYGDNLDEQANLKPAMDALYYLSLLQGVLFFYRVAFARVGRRIVKNVIDKCGNDELEAVLTYLRETRIGCEKNPSFARGRNYITHAVDLIGSKSPDECLFGVQLLYTAICIWERRVVQVQRSNVKKHLSAEIIVRQHMLLKNLIMSANSSLVLQKVLLQALNLRGAYDREMRNQTARIVAYLARDIHLEQFPRGIQHISTLIGTFEEYRLIEPYHGDRLISRYDLDRQASRLPSPATKDDRQASRPPSPAAKTENTLREAYKKQVLRGLCILRKLAKDEINCRVMSEAQGLLPRIMAPLTSDIIHQFNGGAWSVSVVEGSLKVLRLLVAAGGETGARIRQETSNNKEGIRTMERILKCHYCNVKLKKQAMGILIQLYMDSKSRPDFNFIEMLVDIFAADHNTDMSIRKLAGEALAKLCSQSGINTGIILQVNGVVVVDRLTKILLDVENKACRISAAEILEHMCNTCHTKDDECINELQKTMTSTMPKVLAEVLYDELTKDETHAITEADQLHDIVKDDDIENQCDDLQEHVQDENSSSTHPEYKEDYEDVDVDVEEDQFENEEEFRAPLLSLCVTVCENFIGADKDLACQFDAISLPKKLEEMVKRNSVPMVSCLRVMKLTCKMVISLMKHRDSYDKHDLVSLMDALSSASESMCHLDASMVFASEDDGAPSMKSVRSLSSLVEEARESVNTRMASTSGSLPMGDTD